MEKLAYVFTNGIYAKLVVLFNNSIEEVDTETLNERVLNEVLIPNEMTDYYFTAKELERAGWGKDEEGFFEYAVSVYSNDNKEYFYDEEKLIIMYADEKDIQSWDSLYWTTIVELD